jgi:hypothetical protein
MDEKTIARFWAKVDKSGPTQQHCPEIGRCWTWLGTKKHGNSYGNFRLGHISTGDRRKSGAHRVAWEIANGESPGAMLVLHKCDNPQCVNPSHLFLGTQLDNVVDKISKGRHSHGGAHARAKLTESAVADARASGISPAKLAKLLSMNESVIRKMLRGDTWKHVNRT